MNEGTIRIGSKEYHATVIGGKRYIDGIPIMDFLETLSFNEKLELAMLGGKIVAKDVRTSPQAYLNALSKSDERN